MDQRSVSELLIICKEYSRWLVLCFGYFLSLLIGDTYLQWILLPVLMIVLGFPYIKRNFSIVTVLKKNKHYKKSRTESIFLIATALFIWFFVQLVTSHHVPATSVGILRYGFLYAVLMAYMFRERRWQQPAFTHVALQTMVVCGAVISIFSIVLLFFPSIGAALPSFNVLFASYGHNHLASLLVLLLPVAWWFTKQQQSRISQGLFFILLIGLVTSYGRVAIAIAVIQMLALFFVNRQSTKQSKSQLHRQSNSQSNEQSTTQPFPSIKGSYFLLQLGLALLLAILLFKIIFTFVPILYPPFDVSRICPHTNLIGHLCKPISQEARPEYWSQAIQGIRKYPLFGYGLGTFSLLSTQFMSSGGLYSGYAHNAVLQIMAETGVIGGLLFTALQGSLLWALWQKWRAEGNPLVAVVLVSGVGFLFNCLFDFDWDFIGIAATWFVMAGLVIGESSGNEKNEKAVVDSTLTYLTYMKTGVLILLYGGITVLVLGTMVAEYFFYKKDFAAVVRWYPYVSHQRLVLAEHPEWDAPQLSKLINVYQSDPAVLEKILATYPNFTDSKYGNWWDLYQHLIRIAPFYFVTDDLIFGWIEDNVPLSEKVSAYKTFFSWLAAIDQKSDHYRYSAHRKVFLQYALTVAQQQYQSARDAIDTEATDEVIEAQLRTASDLYRKIHALDPWLLSETPLPFLDEPAVHHQQLTFAYQLATHVDENFGYNTETFGMWYYQNWVRTLKEQHIENYIKNPNEKSNEKQNESKTDTSINAQAMIDHAAAILRINPWLKNEIWLVYTQHESNIDAQIALWELITNKNTYASGNQSDEDNQALLQQSLNDDLDYDARLNLVQRIQHYLNSTDLTTIPTTDLTTNSTTDIKNIDNVTVYVQTMQSLIPTDYAVQAQLGHWYLMLADKTTANKQAMFDAAHSAYATCLQLNPTHGECLAGMSVIENNGTWSERFFEVGAIITGEATW